MLRGMLSRYLDPAVPDRQMGSCLRRGRDECRRCLDFCPAGALGAQARGVSLDADLCRGCLLCAGTCPAGCLAYPGRILASWAMGLSLGRGALEIGCGDVFAPGRAWVPCAGSISYSLLCYLAFLGKGLTIHVGQCASCDFQEGYVMAASRVEAARRAMSLFNLPLAVELRPSASPSPDVHEGVSRRSFLGREAAKITDLVRGGILETGMSLGTLGVEVSARDLSDASREWFLSQLEEVKEAVPGSLIPFALLRPESVSEGTARMADKACRTGALSLFDDQEGRAVTHDRVRCQGCGGDCPAWPHQAQYWSPGDPVDGEISLIRWPRVACDTCGHVHVDSYGVCPRCLLEDQRGRR